MPDTETTVEHEPISWGIIAAQHAALLRVAAKGRHAYAESAPADQARVLHTEAAVFESAARLIENPRNLGFLIPTSMQTWALDEDVTEIVAKATGIRIVVLQDVTESAGKGGQNG